MGRAPYQDLPPRGDLPRREFRKPIGRKWSEFIFGRRLNIAHFKKYGWVRVRAYRLDDGRIFYTDPVRCGSRFTGQNSRFVGEYLIKKR
ncbi:MAG: hypothetical protein Tp138OMZ00d2C19078261_25 [Prokaryotic dsDNA virus sp.]|jgi:hypothetical protein|nr:MAG: hypothetical protein Tp138OMZ00d2C19078261_25 [Prokaryotic dsDNA virus sp.]